jgi:DNA topoisomerase VI subunit B
VSVICEESDHLNMSATHILTRQVFTKKRQLDFFTEAGLSAQIGYARRDWPAVLLKELIDNALDAAESAEIVPNIKIILKANSITVSDNGPGLPESTVIAAIDYDLRVSDKILYVAPTRGQLGNALKCIWALPYVVSGDSTGLVDVEANGVHHQIQITGSNQNPQIMRTTAKSLVRNGTTIKVTWPGLACLQADAETQDFYKVIAQFACLNPQATFRLERPGARMVVFPASAEDWHKWRADQPTSPHWYSQEAFRDLVAAYVANSQQDKTVREFVSEFDGLRGSQYQRKVAEEAEVSGQCLDDLSPEATARLLDAMRNHTRQVAPQHMGVIGEPHFRKTLLALGVSHNSFEYKKRMGIENGLPFVVEAAFGSKRIKAERRDLILGLNFSPTFKASSEHLDDVLDEAWLDAYDPVVLAVHQVCPHLTFTSLGKGEIADEPAMREALSETIERVTRQFTKGKKRTHRERKQEIEQEHLDELSEKRSEKHTEKSEIKSAAYSVMEQAYRMTSDDGRWPAKARQIMYAARPLVLEITGKCWGDSDYFTQTLLPQYQIQNAEATANWNVVYDPRGHFREPHTGHSLGIGTLEIRKYRDSWNTSTSGPENRYGHALFIEKEGFDALIDASRIAERFDLGLLSTKGMSGTAARELVAQWSVAGVTTFVAHDFDFSGFGIFHTLGHDTSRYSFSAAPRVVDIGLRLTDVREMNLQSESYQIYQKKDPKIKLREYGATQDELDFLVGEYHPNEKFWDATRVELNAMTSPQLVSWLERKQGEQGVEKLVPGLEMLAPIWHESQRATAFEQFETDHGEEVRRIQSELAAAQEQLRRDFNGQYVEPETPEDLQEQVHDYLRTNPILPWDRAITNIS